MLNWTDFESSSRWFDYVKNVLPSFTNFGGVRGMQNYHSSIATNHTGLNNNSVSAYSKGYFTTVDGALMQLYLNGWGTWIPGEDYYTDENGNKIYFNEQSYQPKESYSLFSIGTESIINQASAILGLAASVIEDGAIHAIKGIKDASTPIISRIGTVAKLTGNTVNGVNLFVAIYKANKNPTWGNYAKAGYIGIAWGVSSSIQGYGTPIGIGMAAFDALGGMNGVYRHLDLQQTYYNRTGKIWIPKDFSY